LSAGAATAARLLRAGTLQRWLPVRRADKIRHPFLVFSELGKITGLPISSFVSRKAYGDRAAGATTGVHIGQGCSTVRRRLRLAPIAEIARPALFPGKKADLIHWLLRGAVSVLSTQSGPDACLAQ
jgi:hypothetical protein